MTERATMRLVNGIALLILLSLALPARAGPPAPATPEEIRERIARAGEAKDHPGADVLVVLDEQDVRVRPSGLARTDRCRVLKMLTDAGVRAHAVLREGFDPATNRARISAVRVHRRDGSVEPVDPAGLVTQPSRQWLIFWGGLETLLDLPRLEVGDCLEIRTSRIGFNIAYLEDGDGEDGLSGEGLEPPMEGHWFEVLRFAGGHPIDHMRYSVHLPEGMEVQYAVYHGSLATSLWRVDGRTVHTFVAEGVPAVKREPHMPSLDDCVTKLVMATVPDWETKSRWFHRVNEGQFEADDAIRAKVAEITAGMEDREERIAACLHWVADHIRYYGTSRGPREGYTLHRGIETFRDRGGVCKDIAGMLITMLRVLGEEAYPALTMAGSRVEEIPADQFNHTVCAVREPDGSFRILDPTWCPVSRELWSSREALQGLVYGTPEGRGLTLSPYFPPEYNALEVVSSARLEASGDLALELDFALRGYPGTYYRRNVDRHHPDDREAAVVATLGLGPGFRAGEIRLSDPRDYSADASLRISGELPGFAMGGGGTLAFRIPVLAHPLGKWLLPDLLDPPPAGERRFPWVLRATRSLRYEQRIELPDGYEAAALPKDRKLDAGPVKLEFTAAETEGAVEVSFRLVAERQVVPPREYAAFREALQAAKELGEELVVLRRKKED